MKTLEIHDGEYDFLTRYGYGDPADGLTRLLEEWAWSEHHHDVDTYRSALEELLRDE